MGTGTDRPRARTPGADGDGDRPRRRGDDGNVHSPAIADRESKRSSESPQRRGGQPAPDPAVEASREALDAVFGPVSERSFAVRYWNGALDSPVDDTPSFTLVLNDPGALRRMFAPPTELHITEAFIRGDFDIVGRAESAAALGDQIKSRIGTPARAMRLARAVLALPHTDPPRRREVAPRAPQDGARHTPTRDAAAVRSHYDVGNDFYKLWLDDRMVYSCAYFTRTDETIDAAQLHKLDHICRKLRLEPGQSLLDVGCGWGGLIMHAAREYGVEAVGITLSYEQASLARERIHAAGLADKCTVEVRDYRHLPLEESFDRIVSVGMVEHVGREKLPEYFDRLFCLLRAGGLLLNHGIVHNPGRASKPTLLSKIGDKLWGDGLFIDRYVFPDGELPSLGEVITCAEAAGFETRDVESLREHYALTLRQWVGRLERASEAAIAASDEPTYRTWRLYMAASAHGFASGRLGLDQVLLAKQNAGRASVPLTRDDIYAVA